MGFSTQTPVPANAFEDLIRQVECLKLSIEQKAQLGHAVLLGLSPERRRSAQNLLHYLALRSADIRPLQDRLARLGLSSLGRVESHVLATIGAVIRNLYLVSGQQQPETDTTDLYKAFDVGADLLELNTVRLMGKYPQKRRAYIIVTMSEQAAKDYSMVLQLLKSGMNCMRINCAHDNRKTWLQMIKNLRMAEQATDRSCRILMDLGGPKLRLGLMGTEPGVLKVRPDRASNGRVLRPARIWLGTGKSLTSRTVIADASIVLSPEWLAAAKTGDRVRFRDARGSRRCWRIRAVSLDGCWAEAKKTAYIANGVILRLGNAQGEPDRETEIKSLPFKDSVCLIRTGDVLLVSADGKPGKPASHNDNGELLTPGIVSLAIPEVYRDAREGEPIFFDDGRIAGVIEQCGSKQLQVRITHTRKPVEKLEGGRGVNLPDTNLQLPALSKKDLCDMEFAARYADMIGLSFANSPDDVRALYQRLKELDCKDVGLVLKIETKRGFSRLPAMILEAMKFSSCGVMIARGDLAVECGFERMCEVQEEIMWICESAHVPVIWATQVLEGLTRRGHATRAEITDAAMSQAAEAVMLNKGSHVIEAVEMLDNILRRMQGHHRKKRSMLRKLHVASGFYTSAAVEPNGVACPKSPG